MPKINNQISLFDLGESLYEDIPVQATIKASTADTHAHINVSKVKEVYDGRKEAEKLSERLGSSQNIEEMFQMMQEMRNAADHKAIVGFDHNYRSAGIVDFAGNRVLCSADQDRNSDYQMELKEYTDDYAMYGKTLLFVDRHAQVWYSKLELYFNVRLDIENVAYRRNYYEQYKPHYVFRYVENRDPAAERYEISKWKKLDKLLAEEDYIVLNSGEDLNQIMKEVKPYTYQWMADNNMKWSTSSVEHQSELMIMFMAPELEQLYKAGYRFAVDMVNNTLCFNGYRRDIDKLRACFNRLCKPGNSPKEFFKTPKIVYQTLKEEPDLQVWDLYRKMANQGKLNKDTLVQAYQAHYDADDMETISRILGRTFNDKPIFSWNSLQNYVNRLDVEEALSTKEALMYINDVLYMSDQLHIRPNITSDSIMRVHKVLERNVRLHAAEIKNEQMKHACDALKKYNYADDTYLIRGVTSYGDLLQEGDHMHNCVGTYAPRIINGHSLIYVMRHTQQPNTSLITIELSPDGRSVRQKYLACNQRIDNPGNKEAEQEEAFIVKWHGLVQDCIRGKYDSIDYMIQCEKEMDRMQIAANTVKEKMSLGKDNLLTGSSKALIYAMNDDEQITFEKHVDGSIGAVYYQKSTDRDFAISMSSFTDESVEMIKEEFSRQNIISPVHI